MDWGAYKPCHCTHQEFLIKYETDGRTDQEKKDVPEEPNGTQ